jgi:ABC-type Mn2+/Zn2+ transport system permease subunit
MTVAFAVGHPPSSTAGFAYALLFTTIGAALLTLARHLARFVSQEAFVGILYVFATAATVLVVDRAPQGAEHVKKILMGSILTVAPRELASLAALYAIIALLHWLARRPLLAISSERAPAGRSVLAVSIWDFLFFLSFGVVVASSVSIAGVLLVFSFLIVPAVIGSIFSADVRVVLPIAWGAGIIACAVGLGGAYVLDLPTGAAMVTAFMLILVLAGIAKALVFAGVTQQRANLRVAGRALLAIALVLIFASGVWLMVKPAADQPLAALFEGATGMGPEHFLNAADRDIYESATRDMTRRRQRAFNPNRCRMKKYGASLPISRASTRWRGASDLCRRCCAERLERANAGWSVYPRRSSRFWGLGGSPAPIGGVIRVGAARRRPRHEIPSLLDANSRGARSIGLSTFKDTSLCFQARSRARRIASCNRCLSAVTLVA